MELSDMNAILGTFSKTEYQHGGEAYRTMLTFLSRNDWQPIKDQVGKDKVVLAVLAYQDAMIARKECEDIFEAYMDMTFLEKPIDYLCIKSYQDRLREEVIQARLPEKKALQQLYVAVFGRGPPTLREIYGDPNRRTLSLQELDDRFNPYHH
jgi:hypothetical protein